MLAATTQWGKTFYEVTLKDFDDSYYTSHSAYAATETELHAAKIDGLLLPNFL